MDTRTEESDVTIDSGVSGTDATCHTHDWRFIEVEFTDGAALRVFECECGAADVDVAA